MEGDFPGNTFNVEKEGGDEADYPFVVNGVIGVSCIDGFL